jgi:8-oxo-dGTP diphosphatase
VVSSDHDRAGEREFLRSYDRREFPAFAVTVDLAVFTLRAGVLAVLLVQRREHPYRGFWALPGGFVRPDESADAAARRELAEETGAATFTGHLEQLRTYSRPDRDPRMRVFSVAHVALAPGLPDPRPGGDAAAARWWPVEDLGLADGADGSVGSGGSGGDAVPLAFDHARVLADALERVRSKLEYTTLATGFVTEPFTIADLRRVYATVWGSAPDLANFRRKVLGTPGFVIEVERSPTAAAGAAGGRPPLLYRRGDAGILHPAMLRPVPSDDFAGAAAPEGMTLVREAGRGYSRLFLVGVADDADAVVGQQERDVLEGLGDGEQQVGNRRRRRVTAEHPRRRAELWAVVGADVFLKLVEQAVVVHLPTPA